jgi:ribonucrease Y
MEAQGRESAQAVVLEDAALEEALRRVEGLERDLEKREFEVVELRTTADRLRAEIDDLKYQLRRRMAEPANRLRAGVKLFNDSEHPYCVDLISKSLGQAEVHVETG